MSTSMHESSKSSVTNLTTGATSANDGDENAVPIIDWSSLVIEPANEGHENAGEEKGIPGEKSVDEHAMFALFGFKTEENVRAADVKPAIPIPNYGLHDCEGADMFVDDKAPNEPLIVWDKRHPQMDVGTPYPNMVAFRKAIKQFAINGEFEYGTKKNEPERNGKGKKNMSPWFDVSVSNLVPSTPTKNQAAATTSSPGPTTRSQAAAATTSSPGPVTRSQSAASTLLKSPPAKGKKMTPKKRKSSDM
ncbi:hypothetical protein ACQ4PT_028849 [Festuca glaucescens]